jgi:pantetheine-phosphate adenylyltransferase
MQPKIYRTVGLGGTFDHFHLGHEDFIRFAYSLSNSLIIGVADEKMASTKPLPHLIEPLSARMSRVSQFCRQHNIQAELTVLSDIYGPTLDNSMVQALAVTTETLSGAKKINDLRDKMGLSELPVHVRHLVMDELNRPIKAERIRAGEINRQGKVYDLVFSRELVLNQKQRDFFSQPQGKIVKQPSRSTGPVCVVGDVALELFRAKGWTYNLGVFDKLQQRKPYTSPYLDSIHSPKKVTNQPGTITSSLMKALGEWTQGKSYQHLLIDGEEDLVTVGLTLVLPLQSAIYYGQPDVGMVELAVSEKMKTKFYEVLKQE